MINLRLGDCLDVLRGMPDGSVDAVVTDPPFTGLEAILERLRESFRLLRPTGVAYVLLDYHIVHHIAVELDKLLPLENEIVWKVGWVSGFRAHTTSKWVVNHNTILQFGRPTYFQLPKRIPKSKHRTGSHAPTHPVAFDTVWDDLPSVRQMSFVSNKSGHPYEKPVSLMERLVSSSVPEAGIVLDPLHGFGHNRRSVRQNRTLIHRHRD